MDEILNGLNDSDETFEYESEIGETDDLCSYRHQYEAEHAYFE